jgi:hypothetical protein
MSDTLLWWTLLFWTMWGLLQQSIDRFEELYDIVDITAPSKFQFWLLMMTCALLWPMSEWIREKVVEWKVEELTDVIA